MQPGLLAYNETAAQQTFYSEFTNIKQNRKNVFINNERADSSETQMFYLESLNAACIIPSLCH